MESDRSPPLRRISSRQTFFYKRIFPVVWLGFTAITAAAVISTLPAGQLPFALIIPAFLAAVGLVIQKLILSRPVDAVWDGGDLLVVSNRGEKEAIPLSEIVNVHWTTWQSPELATLLLRRPNRFGTEVTFMLPSGRRPLQRHPLVTELIDRIDRARRGDTDAAP